MSDTNDIESLLTELPVHSSPPGWEDRVRAAIAADAPVSEHRPPPSRRPLWIATCSVALAAAAAVAVYLGWPQQREQLPVLSRPTIAMRVEARESASRRVSVGVGDTIVIAAEHADELRVYRDGALIARCPGHTGCKNDPRRLELTLKVTEPGALSPIAFKPALPLDNAGPSNLDTDIGLAARVHSQMSPSATIDVP